MSSWYCTRPAAVLVSAVEVNDTVAAVVVLPLTSVTAPKSVVASAVVPVPRVVAPWSVAPAPCRPNAPARMSLTLMLSLLVRPDWEPIWKSNPDELLPSSRLFAPYLVALPMRLISLVIWSTSVLMAVRASVSLPPVLAAWTARSRIRCRSECVSVSAPSAVCTTLMPSCALRTATLRPPVWARRPSLMLRPAASSAARLMRKPLDNFSSDFDMLLSLTDRFRYAFIAAMFWLMRRPMVCVLLGDGGPGGRSVPGPVNPSHRSDGDQVERKYITPSGEPPPNVGDDSPEEPGGRMGCYAALGRPSWVVRCNRLARSPWAAICA